MRTAKWTVQNAPGRRARKPNLQTDMQGRQMVYYVRHLGHIKIGHTVNIVRRLRELGVTPMAIIAWEYGDLTLEAIRHDQFAASRVEGPGLGREHYRLTPELAEHLDAVREAMVTRATHRTAVDA